MHQNFRFFFWGGAHSFIWESKHLDSEDLALLVWTIYNRFFSKQAAKIVLKFNWKPQDFGKSWNSLSQMRTFYKLTSHQCHHRENSCSLRDLGVFHSTEKLLGNARKTKVGYGTLVIGTIGCCLTALADLSFVLLGRFGRCGHLKISKMNIKHSKNTPNMNFFLNHRISQ